MKITEEILNKQIIGYITRKCITCGNLSKQFETICDTCYSKKHPKTEPAITYK